MSSENVVVVRLEKVEFIWQQKCDENINHGDSNEKIAWPLYIIGFEGIKEEDTKLSFKIKSGCIEMSI